MYLFYANESYSIGKIESSMIFCISPAHMLVLRLAQQYFLRMRRASSPVHLLRNSKQTFHIVIKGYPIHKSVTQNKGTMLLRIDCCAVGIC